MEVEFNLAGYHDKVKLKSGQVFHLHIDMEFIMTAPGKFEVTRRAKVTRKATVVPLNPEPVSISEIAPGPQVPRLN
jgi:hypothetical protein